MVFTSLDRAVWTFRMTPRSAGHPYPPLGHVAQVDRAGGWSERQRSRHEHFLRRFRGAGWHLFFHFLPVDGPLGHGFVAGGSNELGEVGVADRVGIDPEGSHFHVVRRLLVGVSIVRIRTHGELTPRDEDHAGGRTLRRPARGESERQDGKNKPVQSTNTFAHSFFLSTTIHPGCNAAKGLRPAKMDPPSGRAAILASGRCRSGRRLA